MTTVVPPRTRTIVEACLVSRSGAVMPALTPPPPPVLPPLPPVLASVTTDFKLVSTGEISREIQSSAATCGVRVRMVQMDDDPSRHYCWHFYGTARGHCQFDHH